MRQAWNKLCVLLTPGVRLLLGILTIACLADVAGGFTYAYDLRGWLALSGATFWKGQFWRVFTYPLLPMGIMNFIFNGIAIFLFGGMLERIWSRGQLWTYCLIASVGAGLFKVVLQPSGASFLVGTLPLVFGLLAAWGQLLGHEKVSLGFCQLTVRQVAFLIVAISFVMLLLSAGLITALVMLSGGVACWIYLWLGFKKLMLRESRVVGSERINRLEL